MSFLLTHARQFHIHATTQVYPNLYNWTTYPLVAFLEQIYEQADKALTNAKQPDPLWVEVCCAAKRALNYMHTGNTAVITTSLMNPLWIGRSIPKDGLPCFNPSIVSVTFNSTIRMIDAKWPWDSKKHRPKSCSERCQVLTYNSSHYNVCISLSLSSQNNLFCSCFSVTRCGWKRFHWRCLAHLSEQHICLF